MFSKLRIVWTQTEAAVDGGDVYLAEQTRRIVATTERELAEIENEVFQLQSGISATREMVALNLARSRNRLQALNLFAGVGSLSCGFGAMLGGIFGMNLPNQYFDAYEGGGLGDGLFTTVTAGICGSSLTLFMACGFFWVRALSVRQQRKDQFEGVTAFSHTATLSDLSFAFSQHFETAQRGAHDSSGGPSDNARHVTKEEFASILNAHRTEPLTQKAVDLIFDMVDTDADGRLDYREYLAFFSRWKEDYHEQR